jgi:predicted O-methyltransferase YrrM
MIAESMQVWNSGLTTAALIAWLILTLALAGRLLRLQFKLRRDRRRRECVDHTFPTPLKRMRPGDFELALRETSIGATLDSEVAFIGAGSGEYASTSDTEAWILSVFAKSARNIFEIGTATGRTTYLLARNSPDDARIATLTLSAEELSQYQVAASDAAAAAHSALVESQFGGFLYTGSPVASKIEQLYGDSKSFDESRWSGCCDLIFIDGSHAYSYVRSDTEKALRMLAPGGVIVWHDYRGPDHEVVADVYRYLNELGSRLPLAHLAGTSFVVYRSAAVA